MALSRIATVVGGLLLSKGGRRFAGRHAGKLALATLAWELFQQHRARQTPATGQTQHQGRMPRHSARPRWRAARTSSR